ncbi:MAG: hypothetical protein ACOC58_02675 [Chloroflexota bacterium]
MPKREEEYYAALRRPKGQPLCPYCGRPTVYPRRKRRLLFFSRTVGWSCANERCRMYRGTFPSPSYGPGR